MKNKITDWTIVSKKVKPIDTRPIKLYEEQIKDMELTYGKLFDSCIKKIDEMQKVGVRFMKESFAEGYFWGFMSGALLVILMVFLANTLK